VLGVNDPNSPSRLSPVSREESRLSGSASLGEAVAQGRESQSQTQSQAQGDDKRPSPKKGTREGEEGERK
jgi:hypothetical protein